MTQEQLAIKNVGKLVIQQCNNKCCTHVLRMISFSPPEPKAHVSFSDHILFDISLLKTLNIQEPRYLFNKRFIVRNCCTGEQYGTWASCIRVFI